MLGPVAMVLQALQVPGVIALFPAVESLRGNIKMATAKTSILTMGIVIIKPFESLPGLPGQLGGAR